MTQIPITDAPSRRLFAVRDFRLLVVGQAVSSFGDMLFLVATPFLIFERFGRDGAATLTVILLVVGVSRLVTVLPAGVLADRLGPRAVMLAADVIRSVAVTVLAVTAWRERPSIALFIGVGALLGASEGCYRPASKAITPALVSDAQLPAANSLNVTLNMVATVVGPAIGGLGVAFASPMLMLLLDAVTFLVSVVTLLGIRGGRGRLSRAAPAIRPEGVLRFLRDSAFFRVALLMMAMIGLSVAGTLQVALPVLADRTAGLGAGGYGLLRAGLGVGMVIGGLAPALAGRVPRQGLLVIVLIAIEAALFALLPALPPPAPMIGGMAVIGAADGALTVIVMTVFQRLPPEHLRGRVLGVLTFVGYAMFPVSVALAGVVVTHVGPDRMFVVTGAGFAIVALVAAASASMRGARAATGRRGPDPEDADVDGTTGVQAPAGTTDRTVTKAEARHVG